jgi:nucleoid-associated protein YgaU
MTFNRRSARVSALVAVDLGVLTALSPQWSRVGDEVSAPRHWAARIGVDGLLGDLGAAALWLLAAWLLLGVVAAWATLLPGAAGRTATRVERRMLPGAARRLLAGAAGLGVLLAPVAASAGTVGTVGTSNGTVPANQTAISNRLGDTPAPRWPQTPAHRPDHPGPDRTARTDTTDTDSVTVRPGDSLWLIAQRRLGGSATAGEIATAWPRWYAANRHVIGDDPGHITPGEVLQVPGDTGGARETG